MTQGPLSFDEMPSGRIEVRLGKRLIGAITPWPQGHRVQAHWLMTLPRHDGSSPAPVPKAATSMRKARGAIAFAIEEWFEGAGEDFADLVRRIRAQREATDRLEVA